MLVLFYIQSSPENARHPLHVQTLIKYKLQEKCAQIILFSPCMEGKERNNKKELE